MKLSQSVLSSAGDCMLKAQYTIDRPSWAERSGSAARAVGTGYHAGLELFYTARMNGLPEPTVDDCIAEGWRVFDVSTTTDLYDNKPVTSFLWDEKCPDVETAHSFIEQMLREYFDGGHAWPANFTVIAVEAHGTVDDPQTGHQSKFGADLILEDPNGWLVLVDHKTGGKMWAADKHHPRKNTQAPWYQRLAKIVYPGYAGYRFVFDIITYPAPKAGVKFERRISDPTPAHEDAVAAKAKAFITVYEEVHVKLGQDLPGNPSSTLCNPKWCDFWAGCPHGAALDS
jgi:PD-(D/E)XK nuclease superfamily